jgi:hypothetical protein
MYQEFLNVQDKSPLHLSKCNQHLTFFFEGHANYGTFKVLPSRFLGSRGTFSSQSSNTDRPKPRTLLQSPVLFKDSLLEK